MKPSDEDWKRAHKQGVADLKKGYEAAGASPAAAYRRASDTQESITNQARAEHERQ